MRAGLPPMTAAQSLHPPSEPERLGRPGGEPAPWLPMDILCETPDSEVVGQVSVSPSGPGAILIQNLRVQEPHRGQGLGVWLVAEALRLGGRQGRGRAWLEADDNGSGRLLRWYRALGFRDIGQGAHGQPAMETSLARALPAVQRQLRARVTGLPPYTLRAVPAPGFTARSRAASIERAEGRR
ncbi:N-acetyltransferase [Vitiosangium sp. GDMCC 1.1324]|uniref:GNAT family N-acetyltransferase n=1 Tax=Vitiosangium sp. (strain GDMCC 1.1324) TaxID=2138576 RepID=UPI000D396374|nr:GNAT family N-acetyltransferase [Vitiosangium sp. GDMCC 1.1324]PTL83703.1 hypothetical protein DAT35_09485 [Vitiosangium sp. GDMCC 1.1324]